MQMRTVCNYYASRTVVIIIKKGMLDGKDHQQFSLVVSMAHYARSAQVAIIYYKWTSTSSENIGSNRTYFKDDIIYCDKQCHWSCI